MNFGIGLPIRGPLTTPENLLTMAQHGEDLGFNFVSLPDHIFVPNTVQSKYPYSETGKFTGKGECVEQLTTLSFLAAKTSTLRLLTGVLVLPLRNPVLTAKMLASIDILSNGRLTVGCGVGWMQEEFKALDAPPFDKRGDVGNEYIRAFKELWTKDDPTFDGNYCRFTDVTFLPKPIQKPHPPIWVGGESPRALRRAALLGDGWYPIRNNPSFPLQTLDQFSNSVSRLRRYSEEAGREPTEVDLAYNAVNWNECHEEILPNGQRRPFTGNPGQIREDIRSFEELGVRHMLFGFQEDTLDKTLNQMDRFSTHFICHETLKPDK